MLSLDWRTVYDAIEGRRLLPERQATPQWDVVPVSSPRELRNLQAAYQNAIGLQVDETLLRDRNLPEGWFHAGAPGDVPSDALHSGRFRQHRVGVARDGLEGLSKFTLVVLSTGELRSGERSFGRGIVATPR